MIDPKAGPADVVLLSCPTSMDRRYGKDIKKLGNTMPNLGLLILAAILRKAGVAVRLIEVSANGYTDEELIAMVRGTGAKVLGMTITTPNLPDVEEMARKFRAALPDLKIAVGGPHIKAVGPDFLRESGDLFDVAAFGEAETIIVTLVRRLIAGEPLDGIGNIMFRRGGEVVVGPPLPFLSNLDDIPYPAWDLLENFPDHFRLTTHLHFRDPAATIFSSRGCPFNCIYCDKSMFGDRIRYHSAEYVFGMMKKLHDEYGIRHIMFYDDTFTVNHDRVVKICEMLKAARLDLTWACMSTVKIRRELLPIMKEAGCISLAYGIESGSQRILKILNKPIQLEEVRRVLTWTKEAGMRSRGFFIIANPGETREDMRMTLDFALSSDLDDFWLAYFTPFPGSACFQDIHKWGKFEFDIRKLTLYDLVFVPEGLTKEEIISFRNYAHRRFYFRPRIFWSYAKVFWQIPEYFWRVMKVSLNIFAMFRTEQWESRLEGERTEAGHGG